MFNLGKTKSLVGLDIGSSSIKAVELKKTKHGYELVSFGLGALAQDTVVDGAIMDAPWLRRDQRDFRHAEDQRPRTWPRQFPATR